MAKGWLGISAIRCQSGNNMPSGILHADQVSATTA
jgi:hypothetical protein